MSRILVVDDDSGSRLVLKSRLTEHGYEVVAAESGALGLVQARESSCDLALVSASLGSGIDGHEVCRRLRAIPETSGMPVVLFHAHAPSADGLERACDAGCDAFLTRAELPALEHAVRSLLRQRDIVRDLREQNRGLSEQLGRVNAERSRAAGPDPAPKDARDARREAGRPAGHEGGREAGRDPARESGEQLRGLAACRPDGLLLVDAEGTVRYADRGACDLFGNRIEGRQLGSLAPASGLEAFARDARIEAREGFRFDLAARKGHSARALSAAVVPLVAQPGEHDPSLRVVLLHDAAKRRLAAEVLRVQESGIPRQELGSLLEAAREIFRPDALIGVGATLRALRQDVARACGSSDPVLIRGDRGTGKERIARTLHYAGSGTGAFLQVRCAALTPEDVEIELFGHVRGAFAGAVADRPGLFHLSQDGTLYLEEIGEVPLGTQAKLLRFLDGGVIVRLGAARPERLDVRLVTSSSAPLEAAVHEGRFLPEFFQRLELLTLVLPSLWERREDIEPLARHYLQRFGAERQVGEIMDDALALLMRYDWPGNVAELVDCMEQACTRAEGGLVRIEDLPRALREHHRGLPDRDLLPVRRAEGPAAGGTHSPIVPLREIQPQPPRASRDYREIRPWDITDEDPVSLDLYEKKALLRALHAVEGDKLAAARLLRVGKSTLYRKLKRFGID